MAVYQPDIFRTSPQALARANRAAAEAALVDPSFTLDERAARAAHYIAEAERHERSIANAPAA